MEALPKYSESAYAVVLQHLIVRRSGPTFCCLLMEPSCGCLQGSSWLDPSLEERFGPFSECAARHLAVKPRKGTQACSACLCSGKFRKCFASKPDGQLGNGILTAAVLTIAIHSSRLLCTSPGPYDRLLRLQIRWLPASCRSLVGQHGRLYGLSAQL